MFNEFEKSFPDEHETFVKITVDSIMLTLVYPPELQAIMVDRQEHKLLHLL